MAIPFTIPPSTRAAGQSGHIGDHNNISLALQSLVTNSVLNAAFAGGADPTGATDSAPAIQAALNAAGSGLVSVPAGTYKILSTLVLPTSGVRLQGAGYDSTTLVAATGLTGNMIQLASTAILATTVTDLKLNGNSIAGVTGGLSLDNAATGGVHTHLVERVWVTGCNGIAFNLGTIRDSKIRDCWAFSNLGDGFRVGGSDLQIGGCTAGQNLGHGFNVAGSNHQMWGCKGWESGWNGSAFTGTTACGLYNTSQLSAFTGNSFQQNALHGIELDGTAGSFSATCSVTGNECDTNSTATINVGSGILINSATFCVVSGNNGANNLGLGLGSQLWGIQMSGTCTGTVASPNALFGSSGEFSGSVGWTNVALNAGFANVGGANANAGYKSLGDRVMLRGAVALTAGEAAFTTMFTLPAGLQPSHNMGYSTPNTLSGFALGNNSVVVTTAGAVQTGASGVNTNNLDLTGLVIPLD